MANLADLKCLRDNVLAKMMMLAYAGSAADIATSFPALKKVHDGLCHDIHKREQEVQAQQVKKREPNTETQLFDARAQIVALHDQIRGKLMELQPIPAAHVLQTLLPILESASQTRVPAPLLANIPGGIFEFTCLIYSSMLMTGITSEMQQTFCRSWLQLNPDGMHPFVVTSMDRSLPEIFERLCKHESATLVFLHHLEMPAGGVLLNLGPGWCAKVADYLSTSPALRVHCVQQHQNDIQICITIE